MRRSAARASKWGTNLNALLLIGSIRWADNLDAVVASKPQYGSFRPAIHVARQLSFRDLDQGPQNVPLACYDGKMGKISGDILHRYDYSTGPPVLHCP